MSKDLITQATKANVASHGKTIKGHVYLTRGDGTGLLIADQNSRLCFYWIPAAGGGVQSVGMAVLDPESGIPFINSTSYEKKLVDLGYKADDPNTEYLFAENAQGVQSGGGVTITEEFFTQVQQPSQAQIGELLVMPQTTPNTEVYIQPGVYLAAADNSKQYWPGDSTTDLTGAIGSIGAGSHQIAWVCLDTNGGTAISQFGPITAASNPLPSRYEFAPSDIMGISINSAYKPDVPVYLYNGQSTPGIVELDILRNYDQRFITAPGTGGGSGGTFSFTAGTGLTPPGVVPNGGTVALATTAVTPGTYTNPTVVFNSFGQATSAVNGTGGTVNPSYFGYLSASIEPLAIEALQVDSFSYTIGAGTVKMLMASFDTKLGSSGRMETRNPQGWIPLSGSLTLHGLGSNASAVIIDPSLPTYTNAFDTYYDRLNTLATTKPQQIDFTSASQKQIFLPGAYGAIIVQVTNFDFTWLVALGPNGAAGWNLWEEINDTSTFRYGHACFIPVSKFSINQLESGTSATTPLGTILYILLQSTWGAVTDPNTYIFRDDFMGASIDTTTVWTRTQSAGGNLEINTAFQWCKVTGDSSAWGDNGMYSQTSTARANGKRFMCDVFVGADGINLIVGWSDGAGQSYTNFSHGVDFSTNSGLNALFVFENGTSRGVVGSGYTKGCTYRVRITLGSSNNATYEIQGGSEYAALGGSSWTNITPGTTSSSTTPLHAGLSIFTAVSDTYVSDVRLFT